MTHSLTLADFTSPPLLIPTLRSTEPGSVITELAALLEQEGHLDQLGGFCEAVIAREQLSPTAMPLGWALPHARLDGLTHLSFALGHTSCPLTWFGSAQAHVQLVFLFAVPANQSKTYLDLVSALARLSRREDHVEQLFQAKDAQSLFQLLRQAPLRPPTYPEPNMSAGRLSRGLRIFKTTGNP